MKADVVIYHPEVTVGSVMWSYLPPVLPKVIFLLKKLKTFVRENTN